MLKTRLITASVLLSVIGLCLFFWPPSAWIAFCILALTAALLEWSRLANYSQSGKIFYGLSTLLAIYFILHHQSKHDYILIMYYVATVFWIVVVPLWMKNNWNLTTHPILAALCGWIVILPAFNVLYQARASALITQTLLFIVSIIWIADSAAYFIGKNFGQHKIAPHISPQKSWEGMWGAITAVSLYTVAVLIYNEKSAILHLNTIQLFATVWGLTILGILGDFFESLLKRQRGLKDSGSLLPGHGGVLDRLDSLLAILPLAGILLNNLLR